MKIERVYGLLKKLKNSSDEVNEYGRRILKYIYQDVYLNYFDKEKRIAAETAMHSGAEVGSIRYNDSVKPFDDAKKSIGTFLEGNNSIITYFDEMVSDNKEEFMKLFFDKIDTYFDIVDNHFYTEADFKVYSFAFNIYSMLKAYHEHKDNFDVYAKILDDCSLLIDCNIFLSKYSESFSKLGEKKSVIDALISCNCYLEVDKISVLLRDVLSGISRNYFSYDVKSIEREIILINNILCDYNDVKEKVPGNRLKCFSDVVAKCTFKEYNRDFCPFYTKILLIGDRLEYINKKLTHSFEKEIYRNNAFKMICSLDFELFEYLSQKEQFKEEDPFISCMEIVFDSDTFYEFNSKMDSLCEASSIFKTDGKKALDLVSSLSNVCHKKQIDGKILTYQNDTMNPVDKPISIFRRMITLYNDIYKETSLNTTSLMRKVFENNDLFSYDRILSKQIKDELEIIEQTRLIEERRQAEIKQELEELASMQRTSDNQTFSSNLLTADLQDVDDTIKQEPNEGKGFQKFKSIFGKRN